MKILLDHCTDWRLRRSLPTLDVKITAQMGGEALKNGKLLEVTASAGYQVLLTVDQNIKSQQNLSNLPISIVVGVALSNRLKNRRPLLPIFEKALKTLQHGQLIEIRVSGITVVV